MGNRPRARPGLFGIAGVAAATAAVAVLIQACSPSGPPATSQTFTAYGIYKLSESYTNTSGTCSAAGRHGSTASVTDVRPAIRDGAPVTIRDSITGAKLAQGSLFPATWLTSSSMCRWEFRIPGVPSGKGTYQVEVGRSDFGGEVAEEQLRTMARFLDDAPYK
jgi:hypothetical protein